MYKDFIKIRIGWVVFTEYLQSQVYKAACFFELN